MPYFAHLRLILADFPPFSSSFLPFYLFPFLPSFPLLFFSIYFRTHQFLMPPGVASTVPNLTVWRLCLRLCMYHALGPSPHAHCWSPSSRHQYPNPTTNTFCFQLYTTVLSYTVRKCIVHCVIYVIYDVDCRYIINQ